jgi:hypothetical protein
MIIFFADDARQNNTARRGMYSLIGIGGFSVKAGSLRSLEKAIDVLCEDAGFPPKEEFKWSPSRDHWMRDNLIGSDRSAFFHSVLSALREHDAVVTIVVSDTNCHTATRAATHEIDVTNMFLERAHIQLTQADNDGLVIVERPGGGRREEDKFLASCVDLLVKGTEYVRPDRFAINVLSGASHFMRCLQAADVITSSSLAFISGETNFSPPIFDAIKPMLDTNNQGYVGGTGLKLHPDTRYLNLYYWLLGDDTYVRGNAGQSLPIRGSQYYEDNGMP